MIELATSILTQKCKEEEWIKWLRDEAASDDGLTWPELKTKLGEIAEEHNYTPTPEEWERIK